MGRKIKQRGPIIVHYWLFIAIVLSIILPGCGSIKSIQIGAGGAKEFTRSAANFQFIKKIAILPFNNLTENKFAGEKVRNAVVMEVLERSVFDVAEEGEVNKVIADVFREMGFTEGDLISLDVDTIQRIAERLEIQALFLGTVESYGMSRAGRTPFSIVSLNLRLVEAKSGITLWRAAYAAKGFSFIRNILGITQKDEIILTNDVAKVLLDTLFGG